MKSPDNQPGSVPRAALSPFRLVDSQPAWDRALGHLRGHSRIAIDLEANSMFAYREQACLIQISSETADFIVDPLPDFDLSGLGDLLADPAVEKIFHAAEYDLILLKNGYDWDLVNLFDTMWAARILGLKRVGLASLLEDHFGVAMSKRYQKSDWCHRPLTGPQLAYAQMDTHYLFDLRDWLEQRLEEGGHIEEAAEIFAEQARVRIPDNGFDPDGFWTLNGVHTMTPAQQATVKALYHFRDAEARRRNLPPFKVMSDQTLLELAEAAPRRTSELAQVFGMSPNQVSRYGRQLLALISRAQEAEPPAPPAPHKRPSDSVLNRYDRLHKWRKARAQERGVESDVIASREALWAYAHNNPRTMEELKALGALGPWRTRTYGPDILRALKRG